MSEYKYPVKYFCGGGLLLLPPKTLTKKIRDFDDDVKFSEPITGETGLDGVLLDFNCGLRLQIPRGAWHVRIADASSEYVFVDEDVEGVTLISLEKFFVEWEIALWRDGEAVFYHRFDPTGQRVHFRFITNALGDNIALLPYVEAFQRAFNCEVTCSISSAFDDILRNYFPLIQQSKRMPDDCYACFYFGAWMSLPLASTSDVRAQPMELFGQTILNTSRITRPPKKIYTPTEPRAIKEPYVCIGIQASTPAKGWLNPDGWSTVVEYLRSLGYRVLCIDRDRKCSDGINTIEQPREVEDFSGDYSLLDRINQLAYADFFIGLGSGLSWLAWAVDIPVVLISGISEPWCEFDTPYRINNPLVCHGCFNDTFAEFKHIFSCEWIKDAASKFECSKSISARQVIDAIDRLRADHNLDARVDHSRTEPSDKYIKEGTP